MKLKTHVASALAAAPLVAYTLGGVHFLLMGAVFPNTDLVMRESGHRRSLLHSIEIPLAGYLFLRFVRIPYNIYDMPIAYYAICFFIGWLAHLLGDFFQGGVGSLILKKKIGITSFTWSQYYNTPIGNVIDTLIFLAGIWGIYTGIVSRGLYLAFASIAVAWGGRAINIFVIMAMMVFVVNLIEAMI